MAFMQGLETFLRQHKAIYTVRRFRYADNSVVSVNYSGAFRRTFVQAVTRASDLTDYVALSGFDYIADWWNAIVRLNRDQIEDLYLYKVEEVVVHGS